MERLAEILGVWLYQSQKELRLLWLKNGILSTNRLSFLIILLFGIVPLTLYYFISGATYSSIQIVASYLFVTLLFALAILIVITWFKSNELFKSNVQGFSFLHFSSSIIDTEFFGFDDDDVTNFRRLVNGLPAAHKIVIREIPKNKQSGNVRFLFTLLDLIVQGGIYRIDTNLKESLNMLITERFTFQNSEINVTTLPSSYSKWCSTTQAGSYDDVRKDISKALGIL